MKISKGFYHLIRSAIAKLNPDLFDKEYELYGPDDNIVGKCTIVRDNNLVVHIQLDKDIDITGYYFTIEPRVYTIANSTITNINSFRIVDEHRCSFSPIPHDKL